MAVKSKFVTLLELAKMMAVKNQDLSLPAVRYRIAQANKRGLKIFYVKSLGPKGRWVDSVTTYQAERLCRTWKNFHV